MLQQAIDLRAEGDDLYDMLCQLKEEDWERPTPFKNWTINDVVDHLHWADRMAVMSLQDEAAFLEFKNRPRGTPPPTLYEPVTGKGLLELWRSYFIEMCDGLGNCEPSTRLKWFGPDMGVRMFTTARQMETWAHGQDVYDLLKQPREHHERLHNIAHIGVATYGWTFVNRGEQPPSPQPYVEITSPGGKTWTWNEPDANNMVSGSALEFCQVVTQGRNIADTNLNVVGEPATQWMAIAQCFAGPPETPPPPGHRSDK